MYNGGFLGSVYTVLDNVIRLVLRRDGEKLRSLKKTTRALIGRSAAELWGSESDIRARFIMEGFGPFGGVHDGSYPAFC
jgi:hypothetical protein